MLPAQREEWRLARSDKIITRPNFLPVLPPCGAPRIHALTCPDDQKGEVEFILTEMDVRIINFSFKEGRA